VPIGGLEGNMDELPDATKDEGLLRKAFVTGNIKALGALGLSFNC